MALTTLASNVNEVAGKWRPYYYKNFYLGNQQIANSAEDSNTYITQTVGTSNNKFEAWINDSLNCSYYYVIVFSTSAKFYVQKYDLTDKLVDTITASDTSGDGVYWQFQTTYPITIDIGIYVSFVVSSSNYDTGDKYRINLPTFEIMERKKIYHGGYSTFIRTAYTEGISFHSDIIPTSLESKNVTCVFNPVFNSTVADNKGATLGVSYEDMTGNSAISLSLEWNNNPQGVHTNASGTTLFGWDTSGETWMIGTVFASDLDARNDDVYDGVIAHIPSTDSNSISDNTGLVTQVAHVDVAGRMGHASLRCEYWTGDGTPKIHAYNQFWHVILIIK